MKQHIGAPSIPVVKVKDEVHVGTLIAQAGGYVSAKYYFFCFRNSETY